MHELHVLDRRVSQQETTITTSNIHAMPLVRHCHYDLVRITNDSTA